MVRQKNIAMEFNVEPGQRARHDFQKLRPIHIAREDSLPPITPSGDVLDGPLKFHP